MKSLNQKLITNLKTTAMKTKKNNPITKSFRKPFMRDFSMYTLILFIFLTISNTFSVWAIDDNSNPDGDQDTNTSIRNEPGWKPISMTPELEVYERWIDLPDGRKTCERRGVFYVPNNITEIIELTSQAEGVKLWMTGVRACKDLTDSIKNQKIIYLLFHITWPFKDKDLVAAITTSEKIDNQHITIHYSSINDYLPLNEGVDRLLNYEATWTIKRMDSELTEVVFTVNSDTPLVAPRWIQDPITIKIFKRDLLKLRELLINADYHTLNVMNR